MYGIFIGATYERALSMQQADQPRIARIAGAALLLICASALFSNDLIVPGDAVATAHNVVTHETRFRVGIFGELLMLNGDIMLAIALYLLLRPVNAGLALIGTIWRLANAMLLAVGVATSLVAIDAVTDKHYLEAFQSAQMATAMRQLLDFHGTAMSLGLVFFGLGAGVHSYLFWQSRYIPRVLSGAYLLVTSALFLTCSAMIVFPAMERVADPWVVAPDFFVELAVALWLLIKGVRVEQSQSDMDSRFQ